MLTSCCLILIIANIVQPSSAVTTDRARFTVYPLTVGQQPIITKVFPFSPSAPLGTSSSERSVCIWFAGDSRLLEMSLSGFNFLIFYNSLSLSFTHSLAHSSPSVSLFHLSKPEPQSQARYDHILLFCYSQRSDEHAFSTVWTKWNKYAHKKKRKRAVSLASVCLDHYPVCSINNCSVISSICSQSNDFGSTFVDRSTNTHLYFWPPASESAEDL